ncbi:MAG: DUF3352 domain-containing protein [Armatimonadota bacterium]
MKKLKILLLLVIVSLLFANAAFSAASAEWDPFSSLPEDSVVAYSLDFSRTQDKDAAMKFLMNTIKESAMRNEDGRYVAYAISALELFGITPQYMLSNFPGKMGFAILEREPFDFSSFFGFEENAGEENIDLDDYVAEFADTSDDDSDCEDEEFDFDSDMNDDNDDLNFINMMGAFIPPMILAMEVNPDVDIEEMIISLLPKSEDKNEMIFEITELEHNGMKYKSINVFGMPISWCADMNMITLTTGKETMQKVIDTKQGNHKSILDIPKLIETRVLDKSTFAEGYVNYKKYMDYITPFTSMPTQMDEETQIPAQLIIMKEIYSYFGELMDYSYLKAQMSIKGIEYQAKTYMNIDFDSQNKNLNIEEFVSYIPSDSAMAYSFTDWASCQKIVDNFIERPNIKDKATPYIEMINKELDMNLRDDILIKLQGMQMYGLPKNPRTPHSMPASIACIFIFDSKEPTDKIISILEKANQKSGFKKFNIAGENVFYSDNKNEASMSLCQMDNKILCVLSGSYILDDTRDAIATIKGMKRTLVADDKFIDMKNKLPKESMQFFYMNAVPVYDYFSHYVPAEYRPVIKTFLGRIGTMSQVDSWNGNEIDSYGIIPFYSSLKQNKKQVYQ